jgi:hypothetical protein
MTDQRLVTAAELAPFIGKVNGQQVLRAFRCQQIPGHRLGRRVLFSVAEVLEYIKTNRASSTPSSVEARPHSGRRRRVSIA